MARYDREFLVPYLEDICALQLAKNRLYKMIAASKKEIKRINSDALEKLGEPEYEECDAKEGVEGAGFGCLSGICILLGIVTFFSSFSTGAIGFIFVAIVPVVAGWYFLVRWITAAKKKNEEIAKRNEEKENDHTIAEMAALVLAEPKVNEVKARIARYEKEIKKVDALLEQQYSVNIIPRWYRDIYPAVYLYDWFSNSRADDLDLALNTLVLEQIKERLDTIIVNQGEMIINQRIMIANQQKSMDMMEAHHARLMAKLDRIEATNEDRNMYLSMIEANTAANAYFSAANYLKR